MTDPRWEFVITGSGEVRDSDGNLVNQETEQEKEK
jgi:hypothetical protein